MLMAEAVVPNPVKQITPDETVVRNAAKRLSNRSELT
jgi:hypothetical protein